MLDEAVSLLPMYFVSENTRYPSVGSSSILMHHRLVMIGCDPQATVSQTGILARQCGLKGSLFARMCTDQALCKKLVCIITADTYTAPRVVRLNHSYSLSQTLATFLYCKLKYFQSCSPLLNCTPCPNNSASDTVGSFLSINHN